MIQRLALAALCAVGFSSAALAQSSTAPPTVPYTSASLITPGTPVLPGRGLLLACSAAGTVRVIMKDGSTADLYAQVGSAFIDNFSVIGVNAAATTATCAVSVLR